jgi:hypothetical protein
MDQTRQQLGSPDPSSLQFTMVFWLQYVKNLDKLVRDNGGQVILVPSSP